VLARRRLLRGCCRSRPGGKTPRIGTSSSCVKKEIKDAGKRARERGPARVGPERWSGYGDRLNCPRFPQPPGSEDCQMGAVPARRAVVLYARGRPRIRLLQPARPGVRPTLTAGHPRERLPGRLPSERVGRAGGGDGEVQTRSAPPWVRFREPGCGWAWWFIGAWRRHIAPEHAPFGYSAVSDTLPTGTVAGKMQDGRPRRTLNDNRSAGCAWILVLRPCRF
jgi:hypothetical protein